jgi:hypothetical protein
MRFKTLPRFPLRWPDVSKAIRSTPKRSVATTSSSEMLREHLANGPESRTLIEAAAEALEIPERSPIVAADELGVRTQRGQWWISGLPPKARAVRDTAVDTAPLYH